MRPGITYAFAPSLHEGLAMIVIDRTSLVAFLNNDPDSAIQRAIDDCDQPEIYLTYETGLEFWLDYVAEHGIRGLPHLLQLIAAKTDNLIMLPRSFCQSAAAQAIFEMIGAGHHPTSRLTLGDCAAYARALSMSARLVCETSKYGTAGLRIGPVGELE
jgi:uncharacterized protein with PIN domain